jgi:cysteine desulfurase
MPSATTGSAGQAPGQAATDLLTVVGQKMYAPKGIAALYVRAGVELEPVIYGGGQERGLRAGTENVPSIAALGAAAGLAEADLASGSAARLAILRDRLHHALVAALPGRVELNGTPGRRLPGTLMGLDENRAMAAIRLSAGRWTSETEIDAAASQLAAAAIRLTSTLGVARHRPEGPRRYRAIRAT